MGVQEKYVRKYSKIDKLLKNQYVTHFSISMNGGVQRNLWDPVLGRGYCIDPLEGGVGCWVSSISIQHIMKYLT